ncbi:hypothetical protein HK101_010188 [Irineochytrium annulatum]|nr:hypothetical protein HK101_010188 [Irineochytrium annulatum]
MELVCTFSPTFTKNWVLRLPCYYFLDTETDSPTADSRKETLTVIGQGTSARLSCEEEAIDFGAILVNTAVEKDLSLYNSHECDVFYALEVYRVSLSDVVEYDEDGKAGDQKEIEIMISNAARDCELEIIRTSDHKFRVYYRLKPHSDMLRNISSRGTTDKDNRVENVLKGKRTLLCDISAYGVNPTVQITDVRSEGTGKIELWQLFSLDSFNTFLSSVDESHLTLHLDQPYHDSEYPMDSRVEKEAMASPTLNFNFGAKPIGSKATIIHLSLMNPGVVPVEWICYFPDDLEVEIENWADPGDYTEKQIHQNLILDNGLFTITPKSGMLKPGDSVHIVVSYSHMFTGLHSLPVVFKLKNGSSRAGKEITVNFIGYTIPAQEKCLYFHSASHRFKPVVIGSPCPPLQIYRLGNGGAGLLLIIAKAEVPISLVDGKTHMIAFAGEGIRAPAGKILPSSLFDTIPAVQKLSMPRQIARLSLERLNFGHVPFGAELRQIVMVRNVTSETKLSFRWILPSNLGSVRDCLKITPVDGTLEPGESRLHYETRKEALSIARQEGRYLSMDSKASANKKRASNMDHLKGSNGGRGDLRTSKYALLPSISPPKTPNDDLEAAKATGRESSLSPNHFILELFPHRNLVFEITSALLDDVIQDFDPASLQSRASPPPFFAQLTTRSRNGIFVATGDYQDGFDVDGAAKTNDVSSFQVAVSKEGGSELSFKFSSHEILGSDEFVNSIETVLESTLFNIMQEVDVGEFELTKHCMTIMGDAAIKA